MSAITKKGKINKLKLIHIQPDCKRVCMEVNQDQCVNQRTGSDLKD